MIRPTDSARFNGTVLLNWQNVSSGAEMRAPSSGELYDGGFAWVGVSAQEVGIYGFPMGMDRRFGTRGGATEGPGPGALPCAVPSGRPGLVHDLPRRRRGWWVPTARARSTRWRGLPVERVVAVGGSQSAMRLVAYFNGVHAIDPIVDGFVLGVWEGKAPRYEEGSMPFGTMTRVRDDIPTPMIVVNSEFEAPPSANVGAVDTDTFRIWEVTGTPHAPVARSEATTAAGRRIPSCSRRCTKPPCAPSQRWLTEATAPRHQPRIRVEPGRPARIPRDELGNAFGGIRLPELAAPLREYRGIAFGTGRPPLMGSSRAFAPRCRPPSVSVAGGVRNPVVRGSRRSRGERRGARRKTPRR